MLGKYSYEYTFQQKHTTMTNDREALNVKNIHIKILFAHRIT